MLVTLENNEVEIINPMNKRKFTEGFGGIKHRKRCWESLVIRKVSIKAALLNHFKSIWLAEIKRLDITKCLWGGVYKELCAWLVRA